MKKFKTITAVLIIGLTLSSCDYVEPNFIGVKQENYGKAGKSDFHIVSGKVNTWGPGTELFKVPTFLQRGAFEKSMSLKSKDNQPFGAIPKYSYEVIPDRAIDVLFANKLLNTTPEEFMQSMQDNILEADIYDIVKEQSLKKLNDSLMRYNSEFDTYITGLVYKKFEDHGLRLKTFSLNLDFPAKVNAKLEQRSEMNSNLENLKIKLAEQELKNKLAEAEVQGKLIYSKGLTEQILREQWIEKWNGVLPTTMTGNQGTIMTIPIK